MYRTLCAASSVLYLALGAAPAALAQCPDQSLQGATTIPGDRFGISLAAAAPRLLVGASGHSVLGNLSGAAYVFRSEPGGFVQEAELLGSGVDAGDEFGHSLAMTGLGALVGAPYGDGFAADSGVVYGFLRSGTSWTETVKLDPGEGDAGDRFGWSVAVDGTRAVIGAPDAETTPGTDGGAVYVFEAGGGNGWQLVTKLIPNDINGTPRYGHSVALSGDRIVVGAPGDNDAGFNAGAAYVFDNVGGTWFMTVKLIQVDFEPFASFGWAVDVDEKEVLVGSPISTTASGVRSGAAYVFSDASGSWTQDAKLFDPAGTAPDRYGYSVALQGDRAMVGAPFAEEGGNRIGRAYECARSGSTWTQLFPLESPSAAASIDLLFGVSVALEGTLRAVGDSSQNENKAWTYFVDGPDCNGNGVPDACDIANGTSNDNDNDGVPDECGNCAWGNYCSSDPNSTGSPAVISFTGSQSVAANDLVLSASPVPNQPGIFYYGPIDAAVPFGNGIRCVGAPFQRLGVSFGMGNVLSSPLDVTSPPTPAGQITPFSVWYFQCWYRDPAAGGAGFDFSDGVKIEFCP